VSDVVQSSGDSASEQGPVVVTRRGKPVAVLIQAAGQEDLKRLLLGHSPKL